jgi:2-phosphosulfolactate phosphatase
MSWFDQSKYDIKFEWGLEGAKKLSSTSDVVIVVDVLSFSTCVEAALSRGASVFPYLYKDSRAQKFAESVDARLACPQRSKNEICLSPPSLLQLGKGDKVVLPSPNGSTICFALENARVLAGCLRNAEHVAKVSITTGNRILVIAAGERWPEGELRPSIEDMIGAGAIISHLPGNFSPEAELAAAAFCKLESRVPSIIRSSVSGLELIEKGFPEDVDYASELNVSSVVPVLRGRVFSCN